MPLPLVLGIAACFLLSGLVKGVIGMGLPTVAMGLLGLAMPASEAAALLILPSLVTNVWQTLAGPGLLQISRRLATLQLGIFAGTFCGVGFLTGSSSGAGTIVLGVVLAAYATLSLLSVRFTVRPALEPWLSPIIGLTTGLLSGATGVFVVPAVPYISSLGLDRERLIKALGLSFTVSTIALGAALAWHGTFGSRMAGGSALAIIPALVGMLLGQTLRSRLDPEAFRRWFFTSLLVIGLYMAVRAGIR